MEFDGWLEIVCGLVVIVFSGLGFLETLGESHDPGMMVMEESWFQDLAPLGICCTGYFLQIASGRPGQCSTSLPTHGCTSPMWSVWEVLQNGIRVEDSHGKISQASARRAAEGELETKWWGSIMPLCLPPAGHQQGGCCQRRRANVRLWWLWLRVYLGRKLCHSHGRNPPTLLCYQPCYQLYNSLSRLRGSFTGVLSPWHLIVP